jgi:septum formation protein
MKGLNKMYPKLFLASGSASRKILLTEAKVPFEVIKQDADESEVDPSLPFEQLVLAIAQHKMKHAQLPEGKEGDVVVVLTADTMGHGTDGIVHGKPKDRDDAIAKIKGLTNPYTTATGFCLEKKEFKDGIWQTTKIIEQVVTARYSFLIPDNWIDRYLKNSWGAKCSGAIAIENYGEQFLDTINGSYTTVKGLPMFELRQALEEIGFY